MKNKTIYWIIGILIVGLLLINSSKKESPTGAVVSRDLPPSASSNGNVEVTVTITGVSGDYFAIVRDTIPSGWTYVSGGSLENGEVKAILSSLTGSSLTYTLKAPSSGTHSFSGTYQFSDDSSTSSIIGDSSASIGGETCTPDCSCSSNTCSGSTCSDGCGGTCAGTKYCGSGGESVSRDLPNSASPSSNVQITLTASGTSGDYFAIVRDTIPSGWTYISGGDLEGNQVKGLLSPLTGSSLTYTLKSPSSTGTKSFSGTYQFTGGDLETVKGDTSISIEEGSNGGNNGGNGGTETCEERLDCEFYEQCNDDEDGCEIAGWVIVLGIALAGLAIFSKL